MLLACVSSLPDSIDTMALPAVPLTLAVNTPASPANVVASTNGLASVPAKYSVPAVPDALIAATMLTLVAASSAPIAMS